MKKTYKAIIFLLLIAIILGCSLAKTESVEPYTVSGSKVHLSTSDLSFKLPVINWDTKPSNYQSRDTMELISFTRTNPVFLNNGQAYFPTISIITEKLPDTTTPESYDDYVRASVEKSGMTIETLDPLTPGGDLMPQINGVGWKTLTYTKQGTSMGYIINIVNVKIGIRFVLESTPENFQDVNSEFIEIIKSIEIDE